MTFLLFAGLALAIVRVTRLLVVDEFPPVRLLREWILKACWNHDIADDAATPQRCQRFVFAARYAGHSFAYVWTCPWCMSFWVGLGVWALTDRVSALSVPFPWLVVAVGSLLSGLLAMIEGEHEQRYKLRERQIDEATAVKLR